MKFWSAVWEVAKVLVAVVLSAMVIRFLLFQPFVVDGSSMEPNFHNGEYLFVEKVSYRFHVPRRGDVVVFKFPLNTSTDYIKRVIGQPGDDVKIQDGKVYVNGQLLVENYLISGDTTIVTRNPDVPYEVHVGSDQFFVMGDNRNHSSDSRDGWLVPRKDIIGRAAIVVFPRTDFHTIEAPKY